jgi:hypothetical protein
MEVNDQSHVSAVTLEHRRLGGLQGRSGRDGKKKKKSAPTGNRTLDTIDWLRYSEVVPELRQRLLYNYSR